MDLVIGDFVAAEPFDDHGQGYGVDVPDRAAIGAHVAGRADGDGEALGPVGAETGDQGTVGQPVAVRDARLVQRKRTVEINHEACHVGSIRATRLPGCFAAIRGLTP